jgi:hypothetical protein
MTYEHMRNRMIAADSAASRNACSSCGDTHKAGRIGGARHGCATVPNCYYWKRNATLRHPIDRPLRQKG